MSSKTLTFVDACLQGKAFLSDIDDWVEKWHEAEFSGYEPTLDEYLGFTSDEGKLWVEKPASIGAIIAAHRSRVPVHQILRSQASYALAARSVSPEDANDVLTWLLDRGRIAPRST
jgi:hypothetical protein